MYIYKNGQSEADEKVQHGASYFSIERSQAIAGIM